MNNGTASVRRYLRYLFAVFLLLDLVAFALVVGVREATPLAAKFIDIRNAMFSKFATNRSELEAPPADLIKHGFLTDSPEERARWREVLDSGVRFHAMFQQLQQLSSTVEKAKLIVLSYSRNGAPLDAQGNPTRLYDKTADLLFKLATIKEPRGLCSDHAQIFTALCNIVGIDSMTVSNRAHTTSAVYCPELKKWVWIDTEYALLAKNQNGEYMSPLELRDANVQGQPFKYEFFGTPEHLFAKMDPRDYFIYQPANFSPVFCVEWGNNELTRDAFSREFLFVPKPIRQLVDILLGLHPTYRYLNDESNIAFKYLLIRISGYLTILLFLIGNLAYPTYCLIAAIKRSFTRPTKVGSAHIIVPEIVLESQSRQVAV